MSHSNIPENYSRMLSASLLLKEKLLKNGKLFSAGRFMTFAGALAMVIMAFVSGSIWWWPAAVLFAGFIVLLVFHERSIRLQRFNDCCVLALNQEIEACKGVHSSFDGGNEFTDHKHTYSTDLDVFGDFSLFQALNRTATPLAKKTLSDWLLTPLSNAGQITERQNGVKELAVLADWRIKLRAHGMVADESTNDLDSLVEWLNSDPLFRSKGFAAAVWLTPVFSLTAIALLISGVFTFQLFLLYMLLPLGFSGFYVKAINRRHIMLSRRVDLFGKYADRFRMLEEEKFSSPLLQKYQQNLKSDGHSAGGSIRKLGRITASLDTRLNFLAGFVLNFLMLWDIRQMRRLEQWQDLHRKYVPLWFENLAKAEAIASLGAFSYANPAFIFPEISTDQFTIKATEAGHPLIGSDVRVNNDILLTHRGHFNVVTGANMAGKSTYLRTIGVNMILALAGAPVCAKTFVCYPASVFTSLRTTDSLSSNQSYFYAELLKLKELIDRLGRGEELFILLDEILKGTNSADKQAGSKALLTQLIGLGASGFIATHDLELGNLEKSFPEDVTNYSFEAEINGDELHFDYKLKPGIARNLNATFLMQKMGITISKA